MASYTFSGMEINLAEPSSLDVEAEQREARDARTRANMSRKAYKDAILARLSDAMDDERTPLGETVERFFSCPIRDNFDYRAVLEMHDGRRLGRELLTTICDCSLDEYQQADDQGF